MPNPFSTYSIEQLKMLESRYERELERHELYGADPEKVRSTLELIYHAIQDKEQEGSMSEMPEEQSGEILPYERFQTIRVVLEIGVSENTYFPESVAMTEEQQWEIFAAAPEDFNEISNEYKAYRHIMNLLENTSGLNIGSVEVSTIGVGYSWADDEQGETE